MRFTVLSQRVRLALVLLGTACSAVVAQAQDDEDLVLPPRLDAPAPAQSDARPGAARLAEPPERKSEPLEEVVVVGERSWRLPDLGSEWRREHAEQRERDARIRTEYLRVYDPDDPTNRVDPFPVNSEMERVGFIEVFRLHFGRR